MNQENSHERLIQLMEEAYRNRRNPPLIVELPVFITDLFAEIIIPMRASVEDSSNES